MEQKKITGIPALIIGTGIFAVVILFLLFAAFPLQAYLGMTGLVITEIGILAIAVAGALIFKQNLKEVFRMKLPSLWEILGTVVLCYSFYVISFTLFFGIAVLFPTALLNTSQSTAAPFWAMLLITAFLPAVCEEMFHRGLLLHFYKAGIKNEWITIIVMGIVFGLFHLDPIRFLPMALMGGAVTYVALKTKSIIPCFLFHFLNNIPGVVANYLPSTTAGEMPVMNLRPVCLVIFGVMLAVSVKVPWLILGGGTLLNMNKPEKGNLTVKIILCAIASVQLFAGSVASLILGTAELFGR